jgi:hypothetical protein
MEVSIDLDLPGLGQHLGSQLPLGGMVQPTALRVGASGLELDLKAPMVGAVTLTADLAATRGRLTLSRFDLRGAGLAKGFVLAGLHKKVAELDEEWSGLRAHGEPDGDRLHLLWPA